MKNSNDTIGNRTRDLLACSTVPQPIALPHTPVYSTSSYNFLTQQELFEHTQQAKIAGFSVKMQLYYLTYQLLVLAVVLHPSSGRVKEYMKKELKQLQCLSEI